MVREENGPAVPELARRMTLCSCELDPVRALAAVLLRMPAAGFPLGDILDDSGYAHRDAEAWAVLLRAAGALLRTPEKLVLFDLDGTLVDRDRAFRTWAGEFAAAHGLDNLS